MVIRRYDAVSYTHLDVYKRQPGCLPGLWNDNERFVSSYLTEFPGYYFSGDGGYRDDDGYIYITGRMDDVINVAGHRLSTSCLLYTSRCV